MKNVKSDYSTTSLTYSNTKEEPKIRLAPGHIRELESSGIDEGTAIRLGIRSVRGDRLAYYGFTNNALLKSDDDFLVYPYYDPWGNEITWTNPKGKEYQYARVKLPEKYQVSGQKYAQPKNSLVCVYIPWALSTEYHECFGYDADGDKIQFPSLTDLRIVEGEKKAIASVLHTGKITIGLGGVCSGNALWMPEYLVAANEIQVLFDGDIWKKKQIKLALGRLGEKFWEWSELFCKRELFSNEDFTGDIEETISNELPQLQLTTIENGKLTNKVDWNKYRVTPNDLTQFSSKLRYGFMPLNSPGKGEKLGIDDWIVHCQKGGDADHRLMDEILAIDLPLVAGGQNLYTENLWAGHQMRRVQLSITFKDRNGDKFFWNWADKEVDSKTKATAPEKFGACPINWPLEQSRDLQGLLVAALAKFYNTKVDPVVGARFTWNGKQWHLNNDAAWKRHCYQMVKFGYGFCDGGTRFPRMVEQALDSYCSGVLKDKGFIGLNGHDVDAITGVKRQIDRNNHVTARSEYDILGGECPKWMESLGETLGTENIELFRACLRASLVHPSKSVQFIPMLLGASGSGKSSLMKVIKELIPGAINSSLLNVESSNANNGTVPLGWYGSRMVIDNDFKCDRKLKPSTIGIINNIAEGANIPYRAMGQDVMDMPTSFTLWLVANRLPQVNASDSEGFYRRFLPIECEGGQRDKPQVDWVDNILKEEGGAILGWIFDMPFNVSQQVILEHQGSEIMKERTEAIKRSAVEDCVQWLEHESEFVAPGIDKDKFFMTDGPRDTVDVLLAPESRVKHADKLKGINVDISDPTLYWVRGKDAYRAYQAFCKSKGGGNRPRNYSNFLDAMERLDCVIEKDSGSAIKVARRVTVIDGQLTKVRGRYIGLRLNFDDFEAPQVIEV